MSEIRGKFSIIVPVFNGKNHLRACLDSILAATASYGNAELLVIDNGSTDGSYETYSMSTGDSLESYKYKKSPLPPCEIAEPR